MRPSCIGLSAAALALGACYEPSRPAEITYALTLTTTLQADRTVLVEGVIVVDFPPADSGPSELAVGEVIVDVPFVGTFDDSSTTTVTPEGTWPVVRDDTWQRRTIRYTSTYDIREGLGLSACPFSFELHVEVVLKSEEADVPLERVLVSAPNTCAPCDEDRGDFAWIEDIDLTPVWKSSVPTSFLQLLQVVPVNEDAVGFIGAATDGTGALVLVEQNGNARSLPTSLDAAMAVGQSDSIVVASTTEGGPKAYAQQVARFDAVGEMLWSTSIESYGANRRSVAVAGGEVFVQAAPVDGLVVDGVVIDPAAANGEQLWLMLDEETGAVTKHAPGFTAIDVAPLPGGGFLALGFFTGGVILAAVESDLSLRWENAFTSTSTVPPRLAVAADGTFYLFDKPHIVHYDAMGSEISRVSLPPAFLPENDHSTLAVGPDQSVFLGSPPRAFRSDGNAVTTLSPESWDGLPWCASEPSIGFGSSNGAIAFVSARVSADGASPPTAGLATSAAD